MMKYLLSGIVALLLISCKSVSLQKETFLTTAHPVALGSVGEDKNFVLEQDYNTIAVPHYEQLKVQVTSLPFSKRTYTSFQEAKQLQGADLAITYNDSLAVSPQFLKLEVTDRIRLMQALESKENKGVFEFLKHNETGHIITSVALAFDAATQKAMLQAEELFLETTGIKSYTLSIYKDKKVQQRIPLSKGVVFAYQVSQGCWKEDDKYQLHIIDLVADHEACPKRSYKSASRAEKNINYYKF